MKYDGGGSPERVARRLSSQKYVNLHRVNPAGLVRLRHRTTDLSTPRDAITNSFDQTRGNMRSNAHAPVGDKDVAGQGPADRKDLLWPESSKLLSTQIRFSGSGFWPPMAG
jgi:hypothetical protein